VAIFKCPMCGSSDVKIVFSSILTQAYDGDDNLIEEDTSETQFEWGECNSCGYREDYAADAMSWQA